MLDSYLGERSDNFHPDNHNNQLKRQVQSPRDTH